MFKLLLLKNLHAEMGDLEKENEKDIIEKEKRTG